MKNLLLLSLLFLASAGGGFAQNNARMLSTPNAQTGTSYTFTAADTTRVVTFNNASPVAVTLPNGATLGFGPGTMLSVVNLGAGQVTITCSSCTISANGVVSATLVLSQGQGADIYGGIGSPAVNYVALPSPSGTFGNITASSLTVSGTGTFANLDDILWVGSGGYANIAAAVTAAGSNPTIIVIRSTYAGTECPASVVANLTFWDFRGGSETCTQNSVSWNQTSGSGLHSMLRAIQTRNSPTNSDLPIYSESFVSGTLPANQSLDGLAGQVNTTGTVNNSPSGLALVGVEGSAGAASTGGTIPTVVGGVFNTSSAVGNTTNQTNVYSVWGQAFVKGGTETDSNVYSVVADQQTAGSVQNFSVKAGGTGFFQTSGGGSGLLPTINFANNSAMGIFDVNNPVGSGTESTFGIIVTARAQGDGASNNSYGGWFDATNQNNGANEHGIHAEVHDTGGIPAEFAVNGTVKASVNSNGDILTAGLVKNQAGTAIMGLTLKKGSGGGNYTNATTAYTVADSTNLCFTVTIPTGWKLGVSASGALSTATAAVVAQAALTDNAACSTANAGILIETAPIQGAAIGIAAAFALDWVIAGDGAAHNIALQFKTSNAADTASLINSIATITPTMKFELMPSN